MNHRIGVLTISDRSFNNLRPDLSGKELINILQENDYTHIEYDIVPDEELEIKQVLIDWCDNLRLDAIFTSGGTGFSPRDITPEATVSVIEKAAPGLSEFLRSEGLRNNPYSILSRGIAGIRGKTLIINLPGSPKGAVEGLSLLLPILNHALDLLSSLPSQELKHDFQKKKPFFNI